MSRDFSSPVLFIKQLLPVPIDMPRNKFKFFRICAKLFIFVNDSTRHKFNCTKNHPFTPYTNYGTNWMIPDFNIVEQILVLASRINYSMNPTFLSKNHARSWSVASGTICTIIHVLNVLYSIILIGAVSPRKAPHPSHPPGIWQMGGMLLPKFPQIFPTDENNNIKKLPGTSEIKAKMGPR